MIVAERKPFEEIVAAVSDYRRVLVAGCGTCVAVCLAGGEKEAGILAAQLDLAARLAEREQAFATACVERQCDREFLDELAGEMEDCDAVLSLACGAGVQFLAERFPGTPVLAGLNTTFIGVNQDVGRWEERCRACRDCSLGFTGAVCAVSLCPKGMQNGPCGGAVEGKCETDPQRDCAWSLIHASLAASGRLADLDRLAPPRDFSRPALPGAQTHAAYLRRYSAHD
ncbi:MAG: methylenetetrahydrofolate reductase C-terminal domain-containing protein [Thermodesulfobacteriota bacterium]